MRGNVLKSRGRASKFPVPARSEDVAPPTAGTMPSGPARGARARKAPLCNRQSAVRCAAAARLRPALHVHKNHRMKTRRA